MSERSDMRQNQLSPSDELLDWLRAGLEEQPAPPDMARRAVDRWAAEGSRPRTSRFMLPFPAVQVLKPVAGAVAIALLGLVVFRYGSRVPQSASDTVGPVPKATRSPQIAGAPQMDSMQPRTSQRHGQDAQVPPGPKTPKLTKEGPTELAGIQPPLTGQTEQRRARQPVKDSSQAAPALSPSSDRDRAQAAESDFGAAAEAGPEKSATENQAAQEGAVATGSLRSAPRSGPSLRAPGMAARHADKVQPTDVDYLNGGGESVDTFHDGRLATKVTLQEARVSLADLMGRLRERSGIEMSVPPQFAERPLAVYCEQRPVGAVLRQLGRLLNGVWDTAGDPERPRYEMRSRQMTTFGAQSPASPETTTIAPPAGTPLEAVPVMGEPEAVIIYRERRGEVKGTRSDDWILLPLRP